MADGVQLGRIAGFPVSVNWSVLVVLWLFTWSLAAYTVPAAAPGHGRLTYWLAGVVGAVLLLGSILAHELAHALIARRAGVEVKGVTLWLFGGVTRFGNEPDSARADFRIAAIGPATSLILAGVFAGVAAAFHALGVTPVAVTVAGWLSAVNLLLGLFNLLPGAPLDGGRIVRAYLWRRHGDRTRAALGATRAGRVLASVLIAFGLFEFLTGSGLGGLWLVFLGGFLFLAARGEETQVLTRQTLAGVRVAQVMSPHPHTGPGWLTVDAFVERYVLGHRYSAYPVQRFDGQIEGLITLAQLRAVPPADRARIRVADVAIPLRRVPTAAPDELLTGLLERLSSDAGGRALVFDHGELVGIITPTDIARTIEIQGLSRPSRPALG